MLKKYSKQIGKNEKTNEPIMGTFWEFCIRYIDDDGVEKQKRQRNFISEEACKTAMYMFLGSKKKNTKRTGLNFEFMFNDYKEKVWGSYRPSTLKTNTYWFERHILPYFKNYLVSQITVDDVLAFQNGLRKKGYKDNTIKNITTQLKSFFNYCKRAHKIQDIPFDRRRTAVKVRNNKQVVIWDLEDFKQFIKYYDNDIDKKALFSTLFYLGVRLEECLALEKRDFALNKSSVTIMRTYQRINGKDILEDMTKTVESRRSLYLCEDYVKTMEEFFAAHSDLKNDERIFPHTQRRVYEWMKRGSVAQGVPLTHPHALRNSLITNAIASGLDIKSVQKFAGHGSSRTTLDVYAKSLKNNEIAVGNLYQKQSEPNIEIKEYMAKAV